MEAMFAQLRYQGLLWLNGKMQQIVESQFEVS